ncbi:transglycosylase SLT domain-containing protein [Streptomyces sp. NPDC057002]|uniref:aggregation-promoting factor C-terminal-like domain-containing protein n=1 Tax=Streptomyces sp. NPDC057002 TaxID=3345992 RepID=UPI00363280AC
MKGHLVSRPKLPDISWRTWRISAAAALAVLMTASFTVHSAEVDPAPAKALAQHQTREKPPASLQLRLGLGHHKAREAIERQASAQAPPQRKAPAPPKRTTTAQQSKKPAARPAQRVSRAAPERKAVKAPAATVAGAKSVARSQMSTAQYNCLDNLLRRESGWNHRATNPSSGAYGLFQALPPSKMSSAGSDWRTSPLTQMRWGLSYIKSRYGTPCGAWNFWQKNHWY